MMLWMAPKINILISSGRNGLLSFWNNRYTNPGILLPKYIRIRVCIDYFKLFALKYAQLVDKIPRAVTCPIYQYITKIKLSPLCQKISLHFKM